jgi:peptidyl-prolyl cis-trans isomerase A (cyclophilin A)
VSRIVMETHLGTVHAEIFTSLAPRTAGNFLRYVDSQLYRRCRFYRSVRPDNDERTPRVRLIQGGLDPSGRIRPFGTVPHETTAQTGLRHVNGALSMARWEVGSAAAEFFVVIGNTPALDCGGQRNPDGLGFAVFGCVIRGFEVIERIGSAATKSESSVAYMRNQALDPPVPCRISRCLGDGR